MTLLVLLIGELIGGVLYVTRDSSSETSADFRRPLPANPLNLTGQILTPNLGRDVIPLVSMLRRSSDTDERENTSGRTRSADVETGEGRRGNARAAAVETTEDSIATISAEGETEDATTERVPPPHPRLTKAERMVRLEAISPKLTTQVDGFDWARVPVESPLFRVFDDTDVEVVPPGTNDIPLRGGLRLAWSSGFQDEGRAQLEARVESEAGNQVAMVEVTISERGEVEKARLISAPNSIHGAMLLSVIKAWQFTPATKDGQAVRYRQVMPLIAAR